MLSRSFAGYIKVEQYMSDISEVPIEPSLKDEFAGYAAAGLRLLKVRPSDDPAAIVAAIDTFVDRH
jgi:hypothetical protein